MRLFARSLGSLARSLSVDRAQARSKRSLRASARGLFKWAEHQTPKKSTTATTTRDGDKDEEDFGGTSITFRFSFQPHDLFLSERFHARDSQCCGIWTSEE